MKRVQNVIRVFLVATALLLVACGGSPEKETPVSPEPAPAAATTGQQLIDLNRAREAGAITEEEYEAQKKKLLDSE
jgi:hypothetical protein